MPFRALSAPLGPNPPPGSPLCVAWTRSQRQLWWDPKGRGWRGPTEEDAQRDKSAGEGLENEDCDSRDELRQSRFPTPASLET